MTSGDQLLANSLLFDELRDENKRLATELTYERQLTEVLDQIRGQCLALASQCKCEANHQSIQAITHFNSIYGELKRSSALLLANNGGGGHQSMAAGGSNNNNPISLRGEVVLNGLNTGVGEIEDRSLRQIVDQLKLQKDNISAGSSGHNHHHNHNHHSHHHHSQNQSTSSSKPTVQSYVCNDCQHVFNTRDQLLTHLMKAHKSIKSVYGCNLCDYKTSRRPNLMRHKLIHTSMKPFVCTVNDCNKRFKTNSSLNHHKRQVHCGSDKTASQQQQDQQHQQQDCQQQQQLQLHQGVYGTGSMDSSDHMSATADGQSYSKQVFSCDLCDYKTDNKWNLLSHKSGHSDDKPFSCTDKDCGQNFETEYLLLAHKQQVHSAYKQYYCQSCDYRTGLEANLIQHKIQVHSQQGSDLKCDPLMFGCDVCAYKTSRKPNLIRHKMSHSNMKPYVCSVIRCYKRFKSTESLRQHKIFHTFSSETMDDI